MLINEVSKTTNLTKKAIEYYWEQGLIFPSILKNGYRNFEKDDIKRLMKISVLRKLGISTVVIKIVLEDESGESLQRISIQKELDIQREQRKRVILNKLSCGGHYSELSAELKAIEDNESIIEKLLGAFPGYYGRFICLHFARFLNEPIATSQQQCAYEKILFFLDNVPTLAFSQDLQEYLLEGTKNIGAKQISEMIESTKKSIENIDDFLLDNKEVIEQYLSYKQSDDYMNSPACKITSMLKEFNCTSGYYDIFIPALKELSTSYAEYSRQLEIANEKFLHCYPEIAKISNVK